MMAANEPQIKKRARLKLSLNLQRRRRNFVQRSVEIFRPAGLTKNHVLVFKKCFKFDLIKTCTDSSNSGYIYQINDPSGNSMVGC